MNWFSELDLPSFLAGMIWGNLLLYLFIRAQARQP